MVSVDIQNNGTETLTPYLAVYLTLETASGRNYDDAKCLVLLPDDLVGADQVRPSGSASGTLCFDIPDGALDGAVIKIEDGDFSGESYFRVR